MTSVGVLGPVALHGAAGPVHLGSARQRRLLAALVAHLASGASSDALVELVWGASDTPLDPSAALQTNVARLRRVLPADVVLVTTTDGYRLEVARSDVDVTAFADHVSAAAAGADAHRQLEQLEAGLALWRGHPYADLDSPALQPELTRLTALHVSAREQCAGALLAVGRAAEAVAALEALVVEEPLRESAVALLMKALVAGGRQRDALAAYARLRTVLADELGLDPTAELRLLEQQVLRQEVVAPVTAPPRTPVRSALALPVSSFVGRDDDVAAAAQALTTARVLTLCGPGGVGKTRLALHVAAQLEPAYEDGVVVVELGDGGPQDVEATIAAALRLADAGEAGLTDRIVAALAARRLLLVLDNCEHVAPEVAPVVEAVARRTTTVDLLLTSREPLRVDGEHVLAVRPLRPEAATRLLDDRLRAADRDTVDEPDREQRLAELSRRLDGLPLALELAAARAPALGLAGLVSAMDEPLDVLDAGRRSSAARHRSLREVVAWSYGLLDDSQRRLFERLSVFAGPFEQQAVAAVCGDATALPDLVDRSLVVRHAGTPPRFGVLETLRAYGRSRLATDPAATSLRVRHAQWALGLAVEIDRDRQGAGEPAAVRRFDDHLADLRRAHAWLREHGPLEDLLTLGVLFGELAYLRGRVDLLRLAEEALDEAERRKPTSEQQARFAHLLALVATATWQRGDLERAEAQARRAVALAGDDPAAGHLALDALSNVCMFTGRLDEARAHADAARVLARAAGTVGHLVLPLTDLVLVCTYAGDDDAAARYEAEMRAVPDMEAPTQLAYLHYAAGERRAHLGRPDAAEHLRAAMAAAEDVDSAFVAGIARHTLLTSSARHGLDPAQALTGFGPLLDFWEGFGAWTQWWIAVRALTDTLSRLGAHADATVLLGALEAAAPVAFGADLERAQAVEQAARSALGASFAVSRARGRGLGLPAAVSFARGLVRAAGTTGQEALPEQRGAAPAESARG